MDDIARAVLRKLFTRRVIGKHHIRWATLMNCGWKGHEKGSVRVAIKSLLKQGFLLWAKKSKKALVLNKERIEEIKSLI